MRPTGWESILEEGEAIVWQGAPDPRPDWSLALSPSSGLALLMLLPASWLLVEPVMWVAGIALSAAMLALAFRPVVAEVWLRRHTFYSLSTRAAYIGTEVFGRRRLARHPLDDMGPFLLEAGPPGNVWFDRDIGTGKPIGFGRIADAPAVYALLRDLCDEAVARAACQPGAGRVTPAPPNRGPRE